MLEQLTEPTCSRPSLRHAAARRVRPALVLLVPALLASAAAAQIPMDPKAESGLGPTPLTGYPWRSPGAGFTAVGQATNTTLPGITDPVVLPAPELPNGCAVREVVVIWNFYVEEDDTVPTSDLIQINGTNVSGSLIGFGKPGLGPGKSRTLAYFRRFTELGTNPVVIGTPGSSLTNSFAGVTNKAVGSDPAAIGAGFSVLLVYGNCAGEPTRVASVFAGMTTTRSSPRLRKTAAQLDFLSSGGIQNLYQGGELLLFANALEGEAGRLDVFKIGLNSVGGLVSGTSSLQDAFTGQLCPDSQAPCTDYSYDHVFDDVRDFVQLNVQHMTLRCEEVTTQPIPDDVGQSIAAFSFHVIDQVAACGVNNGNGINPLDLSVTGLPQLGGTFQATTVAPAALFFATGPLPAPLPGVGIFAGEFLCDITSPLTTNVPVGTSFSVPIPLDASLTGTQFCVQAAEFVAPGAFQLTNAFDCSFGS